MRRPTKQINEQKIKMLEATLITKNATTQRIIDAIRNIDRKP